MKKLISLLVVLAMLMAMVPAVYAAEATESTEYQEVTISEAIELAEEASETEYLVRGTITEVSDAMNGNMYIKDAEGNTLYIYGAYDVDGANRYDAMTTKPQVGDEVLLLGALTTYDGTAQMKNARVQDLVVQATGDVTLALGNNELDAGDGWTPELTTGQFVAPQAGTLYITIRAYYYGDDPTFNEILLEKNTWVQLKINGELITGTQQTVEVAAGDVVTVTLQSVDGDSYHAWINLSFDGFYEEPMGTAVNPVILKPNDCPTDTITIPAGEEIWYHLDYSERGNQFSDDHILYVYGENAYILIDEYSGDVSRIDAVDGVVTYAVKMYDIRIGNAGTEDAVFELDCEVPVGAEINPHEIVDGVHVVNMVASSSSYYFEGYAPADGTLTVTVDTVVDGYWYFNLKNEGDPNDYSDNIYASLNNADEQGNTVTIDVKKGDRITADFKLMDKEYESCDGTVTFTFDYSGVTEEPPVEPPVAETEELTLGNTTADVAEGKAVAYTWTATEDALFAISMLSNNWTYRVDVADAQGTVRSSTDAAMVNMTVVKVAAGDVVTLTIGTADGAAAAVNFNTATYEGTASDPVALEMVWNASYSVASLNVDLPAGEYVYSLPIFSAGNMELKVNGKVTEFNADPMGWDPATVVINNESEGNAVFSLTIAPPSGTMYNPDPMEEGVNVAELIYADYQMMRCYSFTAEEDTLLALNMMGDNWYYWGVYLDANGNMDFSTMTMTYSVQDDVVVSAMILKVEAGQTFMLVVGTVDGSDRVTFGALTSDGTAENPAMLQMIWNDANTAASLNVELPAGEYVYGLPIFGTSSLELTVNGEKTAYESDPMGWDASTVVINNESETGAVYSIEIAPPSGTMFNPDELEMGYNEAELIFADYQMMRAYAYTAEEDTLLALTMMGENWYYWGMLQDANGNTTAWVDGHDATAEPFVPVQVVKIAAGETFVLILGSVDASETVAFEAMTYAGTEEDPVMLEMIWNASYSVASLNADLPAGEYVYALPIFGSGNMELTINGEVTEFNADPMGWDPATVVINNDSENYAVFSLTIAPPSGTMFNPDELEMGYNEAELIFADYQMMRAYAYTAEEDTLLVLTMMGENWYYWGMLQDANGNTTAWVDGHDATAEPFVPVQIVKIAAGETFVLILGSVDASETVAFEAMTYAGTEEDPIMVEFNWNDEWTAASLNIDMPAGEYVFGTRGLTGTILTANGEEIPYVASGNLRTPDMFVLNNEDETYAVVELELSYPPAAPGTMDNPEVVEEGEYTVEIGAGNMEGHYLSWTAEEDGVLTITISAETEWYLVVWNNNNFDYEGIDHWSGDHPGVDTFTIDVKAGDEIIIVVNVYDDESGLQAAGEVTVVLDFTPAGEEVTELGDVNGDGLVDTTDAKLIMQYDLSLVDETALDLTLADVNGDGEVDTTDAKLIMQLDLGLITAFPNP